MTERLPCATHSDKKPVNVCMCFSIGNSLLASSTCFVTHVQLCPSVFNYSQTWSSISWPHDVAPAGKKKSSWHLPPELNYDGCPMSRMIEVPKFVTTSASSTGLISSRRLNLCAGPSQTASEGETHWKACCMSASPASQRLRLRSSPPPRHVRGDCDTALARFELQPVKVLHRHQQRRFI